MKNKSILLILLLFAVNIRMQAQTVFETQKLFALDAVSEDYFGESVGISGDYIVVGATGDDENGDISGSAYVFQNNGGIWQQVAKLTPSEGSAYDFFGYFSTISGDYIFFGVPYDDDNGNESGSVYVFEKPVGGWKDTTETAKLTASDAASADYFGHTIAISGDCIVIGANGNDDAGSQSGAAYVFVKPAEGWIDMTETAKLTASDAAVDDRFGVVSISGDCIVIGAPKDDDNGSNSGSAYVFVKPNDGWTNMTETAKILPSDGAVDDFFGISVGISGNTIAVGAFNDDDNGNNSGSCYVFSKPEDGWINMTETAKLTSTDGSIDDQFGEKISISGDLILITSQYHDYKGSAYLFKKPVSGWNNMTETCKLLASDGTATDNFGVSVSISGSDAIVGSYTDDDMGPYAGAAYVFDLLSIVNTVSESNNSIFTVYPNPSEDELWIHCKGDIEKLWICDMSGKKVYERASIQKNETINLSNLKRGIYLLQIKKDTEIISRKILKL
jgi:hypothetical protein